MKKQSVELPVHREELPANGQGEPLPRPRSSPRATTQTNIHNGHRDRLRRRFRNEGLEHFEAHEVMELLLSFSIPRRDVNEEAHALVNCFGSVAGALDASEAELQTIKGIGRETAFFLHSLPAIFRRYAIDATPTQEPLDTAEKITTYLHALYVGEKRERAYLLLFDNSMHLLDCSVVGDGSINQVYVNMRTVMTRVLAADATCAVLAHNHPCGPAFPSNSDHELTDYLIGALDLLRVSLLEHFLLTKTTCVGILRKSRGLLRASPVSGEPDKDFWRKFYGEAEL